MVNKKVLIYMVVILGVIGLVAAANIFVDYNMMGNDITNVTYAQGSISNFTTYYGNGQYLTGVSSEIDWATNCTGTNYFMFGTNGSSHYCAQVNQTVWGLSNFSNDRNFVTSSYKPNVDGENITAGTVADARIASTITRDTEVSSLVPITYNALSVGVMNVTTSLNMTNTNVSSVDCIVFKSGGKICNSP